MKKTKIIVAFSGGKDSLACLIWAMQNPEYKNAEIEAVFCDTGWEHEITYQHINEVVEKIDVKLVTVKSKKYDGFVDMSVKKQRFPSTKARFCTEELKSKPMIDYILDHQQNVLIIQGIRKDESFARSKMAETCTFFKFYYEPYLSNQIIIEHLESLKILTPKQVKKIEKAKERLADGFNDEKFHTHRKKEVFKWREKNNDDILRPVFNWTGSGVMKYIVENGYKPNPLYYQGAMRVGCYPCIMCRHDEIKNMKKTNPEYIERLKNAEKKVGRTFFPPEFIPAWATQNVDQATGKKINTVDDVVNYIDNKNATIDMFAEDDSEDRSCMSYYGLCE